MKETVSIQTVYVGVDISSETLQVRLMEKDLSFSNDAKGIKKSILSKIKVRKKRRKLFM